MLLKQGARVITADQQHAGHVERIVVDPRTKEISHLVVEKGFLFTQDKIVPWSLVQNTNDEGVWLNIKAEDVAELTDYQEVEYVELDADELARTPYSAGFANALYFYPTANVMHPGAPGYYGAITPTDKPMMRAETHENLPPEKVALEEGAEVVTDDDRVVGTIEKVIMQQGNDQISHLVVAKGLLLKERKIVPMDWVKDISEDKVILSVGSRMVENLKDYHDQED